MALSKRNSSHRSETDSVKVNVMKMLSSVNKDIPIQTICRLCGNCENKLHGYCQDCQQNLCGTCIKIHRSQFTKEHTIWNTCLLFPGDNEEEDLDWEKNCERNKNIFSKLCDNHPQEYEKYFCIKCDKTCCQICCTVKHKSCEKVAFIPDIVNKYEESDEFESFYKEMGDLIYALEKDREWCTENIKALEKSSNESANSIKKQRKEINEMFDKLEETIQSKNSKKKEAGILKIREIESKTYLLSETLKTLKRELNKQASEGYICQMFIAVKRSQESLKKIKAETEQLTKEKVPSYVYERDSEVVDFMASVQELGDFVETTGEQAKVIFLHEAEEDCELDVIEDDIVNVVEILEDGWLKVELNNRVGIVPASCVEMMSKKKEDENAKAISSQREKELEDSLQELPKFPKFPAKTREENGLEYSSDEIIQL